MSENEQPDLVTIAEREVLDRAKIWAYGARTTGGATVREEENLLAAVALLEARENLK